VEASACLRPDLTLDRQAAGEIADSTRATGDTM
jgi:hypothetical protein